MEGIHLGLLGPRRVCPLLVVMSELMIMVENGPQPDKAMVIAIRQLALSLGDRIDRINAYMEIASSPRALTMRRTLLECGATIIDTPHNGLKETADKVLIYELADLVARRRTDVVLLISDDADFNVPISRVQQSGIPIARAGFQASVAEIVRPDRTFNWQDGGFVEIFDAPLRIRKDRRRFQKCVVRHSLAFVLMN